MPSAVVKAQKLEAIRACIAAGEDAGTCCLRYGVPRGTYYRWQAKEQSGGLAALSDGKSTGRPASLVLSAEESAGLTAMCALMKVKTDAVEKWMDGSEAGTLPTGVHPASAETIAALRALKEGRKNVSWPQSVRRAMQVPVNITGKLRGGLETLRATPSARRGMIWVDESGQTHQVEAGHIYSSDDMSHNEPHRYYDRDLGRETVGRQALLTVDLYSNALISETSLGRRKDAYRVEDIASHVSDTVASCGLPLIWRFEKGVWDNNWLYGLRPPPSWLLPPGTLFGAIDGVLFRASQKHSPRGKGEVERAFREYQKHTRHLWTSVGNIRGEYAITARLYRQAVQGNEHALRKFWTISEAAKLRSDAMRSYIETPQIRRALGNEARSPLELWGSPVRRAVPASEAWRLLPVKACGAVRGGIYECKVEHYPVSFRFLVTGTPGMPVLDYGHRVFAAFDPARPELGCHLFNAEPKQGRSYEHGRRLNREGFSLMEPLGVAAFWADVAQENFAATAADYRPQTAAAQALRSEFTSLFRKGAAAALTRTSKATDQLGRHVSHGTPLARPESAPQLVSSEAPAEAPQPRRAPAEIDLVTLHRRALPARETAPSMAGANQT